MIIFVESFFFAVGRYPIATFVSNKVIVDSDRKTAKVLGLLSIRGVTKPVTLNVKLNKIGDSSISNKLTAGFSATTTINRSDFGMITLLPGLSNLVNLDIEAEAYKVK
jgi:polyisoprenoid-binding protein YceI